MLFHKSMTTTWTLLFGLLTLAALTGCQTQEVAEGDSDTSSDRHTVMKPPSNGDTAPSLDDFEFQGRIVDANETSLTVSSWDNQQETFTVDSMTEIQIGDAKGSLADLARNSQVTIVAELDAENRRAKSIRVESQDPAPADSREAGDAGDMDPSTEAIENVDLYPLRIEGEITNVSENEIVIVDAEAQSHTIDIRDAKVTLDGEEAAGANLKQGQLVIVDRNATAEGRVSTIVSATSQNSDDSDEADDDGESR